MLGFGPCPEFLVVMAMFSPFVEHHPITGHYIFCAPPADPRQLHSAFSPKAEFSVHGDHGEKLESRTWFSDWWAVAAP